MLSPFLAFLAIFKFYPLIDTFRISFGRWAIGGTTVFIGFENYKYLFTSDPLFWKSLFNNLLYVGIVLITIISLPLAIAIGLNTIVRLRIRSIYTALYYFSYIVPEVAVGLIWRALYDPTLGVINFVLVALGLPSQLWLASSRQAMFCISVTGVWKLIGFGTVIYLGGLQGLPIQYYEAAEIDGASKWQCFFYITIPLLAPVTLFLGIINLTWAFQVFAEVYVMTLGSGGPANSTYTLAFYLYREGFRYFRMGYAAAIGFVLFAIIFTGCFLMFVVRKR